MLRLPNRTSKATSRPPHPQQSHAGRQRRAFVGVDIGVAAVKLVELAHRPSTKTLHLRTWGVEPLPHGAVQAANAGANISDPSAVGEAIRRLRSRLGAKARAAALAVPYSAAVIKTLRMDAGLSDEELEVEVGLEAERHIPFPPEQTALDFELSQLCLDDPALAEVVIVACRVDHVRGREAAAAAGGLRAAVVEVETAALARAARCLPASSEADGDAPVFLAALGANSATLLAVAGEEVVFARQEPLGIDQRSDVPAVDVAEELVRGIARLVRLGLSAPGVGQPVRLLLAGGRSATPGLVPLAEQRLGLAVALADPVAQSSGDEGPQLLTACGLARRGWGMA